MSLKLNSYINALQTTLEQKDWERFYLSEIIHTFKLWPIIHGLIVFMEVHESDTFFDLIDMG